MTSEERAGYELELAANVKVVYYELWFIQQKIEVNKELQSLVENFIRSAERLYEVDRIGLEAILSAQTELAKLATEERTLLNEYNKTLAMFNQLLYRELETLLGKITELPPESIPADIIGLERKMLDQHPDLQGIRYGIEMNEAEIKKHPFQQELLQRTFHPDGSVGDW